MFLAGKIRVAGRQPKVRITRAGTTGVRRQAGNVIRNRVFELMGLGKGTLAAASMPKVHQSFEPTIGGAYPVGMAGDRSKVPFEYSLRGWGHREKLLEILTKDRVLAEFVASHPNGRQIFERAIEEGLRRRALKGYEEEWSSLSADVIRDLVGRAKAQKVGRKIVKPTPLLANEFNARMVVTEIRGKIKDLPKGRYTIMDLGAGGGGTIIPIVERLSPVERRKLEVVLVDVMKLGLEEAVNELQRLGIDEKQITCIRGNISRIESNKTLQQFAGRVDLVTGGAALHHTSDIVPTFRGVNKMLKKGGLLCFWDWGHAAWKGPNLIYPKQKGARVSNYGQHYEFKEKGGRIRTVSAREVGPEQSAFISRGLTKGITRGWTPTELNGVRSMLSTWISLLKYPKTEQIKFLKWFDGRVKRGEPINFESYLQRLEGVKPEGFAPIEFQFREGHRPPELYHDAMRKAGLVSRGQNPFTIYSTDSSLLYQMRIRKS